MTPKMFLLQLKGLKTQKAHRFARRMMTESLCRFTLLAMDVVDITILGNKNKLKIR
jgi:hypothetical protein